MTGKEAIEYLDSYYLNVTKPDLNRIITLMNALGNPQKDLRCVHVAGTNGKGSTCAMVERMLREAGYRSGLFTSPHLIRYNERMQICGVPISDEELGEIVEELKPVAESTGLTFCEFEMTTAVGLIWFARQKCDIVVLEVGLGGEFDATNVIDCPECAVITNIGLDHTAILGNTVEEVASAKAGIIKPGCDTVVYRSGENIEAVFAKRCAELGARIRLADFASIRSISASLEGQVFDCGARKALQLGLLGEHQMKNACVALTVIDVLRQKGWNVSEENIRSALANVHWPVRFQVMQKEPLFILDGGHNTQCIESLAVNLRTLLPGRYLVLLLGVLGDKDIEAMSDELAELAAEFVTITPESSRALPAEELAKLLKSEGKPVTVGGEIADGIEIALRHAAEHDGAVCCVGSLYQAGEVLEYFQKKEAQA